jgi:anti-sigma factor RsiW
MSENTRDCEWILERLDAFVDDDLGADERAAVAAHCAGCTDCAREMETARRIRDELRALPALAAPAHVIDAAEHAARAGASRVIPIPGRRNTRRVRTALLVAATVAVVGAGAWFATHKQAAHEQQISDADVRHASAELALAFGYVDRYSGGVVREDVLRKRVMPRIERALTSRDSAKPGRPNQTGM